jgi:hypothetical protein
VQRDEVGLARTGADHHEAQPVEIPQEGRCAYEQVEVLRVADVPRVHDDERVRKLVLPRPRVVLRRRLQLVRVDPVRDHLDAVAAHTLLDQAPPHRLADHDDAVRPAQADPDEQIERSY